MRNTIPGLHHVTAISGPAQENVDFYAGVLGLQLVKRTVNFDDPGTYYLYYGDALGRPGTLLTFFPWADVPRGREGAGTVHHVAFRARGDDEQRAWQERIAAAGLTVTDVRERTYFRSVYFREPGGILFEIATDPPGFTADESPAELGSQLKLPPWREPHRARLEASLVALEVPYAAAGEQPFPPGDAPGWTGTTLT